MVESNNAINNTVGASISGVTNTLSVTNPSNTASSAARATISVGGGSSADPTLNFNVSGVTDWEMGIDNSASDFLKISQGTSLGTNDTWIMTTSGERTMPLQPAFLSQFTVDQNNVTGNGSGATVNYTNVIFDQNSDYDGTNTFTAPVTGRYFFGAAVNMVGFTSSFTAAFFTFTASNRSMRLWGGERPANIFETTATRIGMVGQVFVDMDAGDTASVTGLVSGSTQTIDFTNNSVLYYFYGYLVC
jgi:hypothetical protein